MATVTSSGASPDQAEDDHAAQVGDVDQVRARGRRPWTGRAALVAPAALMLGLGFLGLDRHSMWRDEAASLVAARRGLPELWRMLGHVDAAHALYYTLLHVWLQLGAGEVWARVPSVLAMAAAAGLVAVVGARLASVPVGVVAGGLFAANPSVSHYAQEARSTALVAAVALLATWFLLQALERRPRWWAAYAGACVVLVGLNLLASLVVLALGLTLLWWRRSSVTLLRWAAATSPALLVALVLVMVTDRQPYQTGWIPRPGIGSARDFAHLTLGPTVPLLVVMSSLVLVGVLPGGSLPAPRLRALAVPLLVVPALVLVAASLVQPVFVPRYVFPSVPATALLAAVGVVRLGRAAAGRAALPASRAVAVRAVALSAVAVVALAGLGAQRLERTPASRPDDLAGAAAVVAARARPGDAVLFLPDNRRLVALVYPGSFVVVRDLGLAAGPDVVGNLTGRPLPLPTTLHDLAETPRVWVVGRPGLVLGRAEADARAELELLDRTFTVVERTGSRGVGVTLYAQRPAS